MIELQENEEIQFVVRKHWFILFGKTVGLLFLFLLPLFLYYVVVSQIGHVATLQNVPLADVSISTPIMVYVVSLWTLLLWMRFFVIWTDYYLDGWFITNKRIIDVEQKGFFRREVSSFRLDKVQDITIEINGPIATFLDYGTIHAQTAGESREILIKGIPRPYDVKEQITTQCNIYSKRQLGQPSGL